MPSKLTGTRPRLRELRSAHSASPLRHCRLSGQTRPPFASYCATITTMKSSAKALKKSKGSCTEEGDRHRLLELRPLSSIFDSSFSGELQVDSVHT
uniref:Uncharacterized protein n=1 Tax=Oryza glumipatula TaxID=40148 RepID=A0A0E0ATK5_9ORYZ